MIDEFELMPPEEPFDPFAVMLFKALQVLAFLFFIALLAIAPEAKDGKVDSKAEFVVTMTWPDQHPDDFDMFVQDPIGNMVWYGAARRDSPENPATSNSRRCPSRFFHRGTRLEFIVLVQSTLRCGYFNSRSSAFPAGVFSSLASSVPSLSGFAALKRCSTTARYSSKVSVPSWSGSAAASSLALSLPASSRLSTVPS
jgi:hypothetical protein